MRICLVTHGFPPLERTGVENYTAALARALAAAGHAVEVFTPRVAPDLPDLSMRRFERDGYGVTWLTTNTPPRDQEEQLDLPGAAERFGDFLDRERPEIIHFQHLIKLGMGLVDEAVERDLPTVYTAHDYYPVCHRFTLMRPDMRRCDTVGRPELCARCDLGLSYLNRRDDLGDYQLGALPEQLDGGSSALSALLDDGDAEAAGFTREELKGFVERREALDRRRLETFRKLDWIVSPTRFLADRLVEGGIDAEKIEVLTYGAEVECVQDVAPVAARSSSGERTLRFGFLGGLSKHKGVHVLLDAFARLDVDARLLIWGASSDRVYVDRLRASARASGAEWRGPYKRSQLGNCLAEVDVVVVPSTWVENYPFVIREAFAAGRPVITSDVGALPESVRDGVDGLLVEPENAGALAAAMRRIATEDGLLERLCAGIQPVKSIATQADELVAVYARLLDRDPHDDASAKESEALPASLRAPLARYQELASLPLRDLFRSVMDRLDTVRAVMLGGEVDRSDEDDKVGFSSLAAGSHAQTLLRDLKHENDWLNASVAAFERTEAALRERLAWRESDLTARDAEIEWLRTSLEDREKSVTSLAAENEWRRGNEERKDEEIAWYKGEIERLQGELDRSTEENEWLRDSLIAYEHDMAWYHERGRSLEAIRRNLDGATHQLHRTVVRALTLHKDHDRERVEELLAFLERDLRRTEPAVADAALEAYGTMLAGLLDELGERRRRMRDALTLADRGLARILISRTGLGRALEHWDDEVERKAVDLPDLDAIRGAESEAAAPEPPAEDPPHGEEEAR